LTGTVIRGKVSSVKFKSLLIRGKGWAGGAKNPAFHSGGVEI